MNPSSIQTELENQFNDVVSRLQSKQMFQSSWDIASFAVFFIFIGLACSVENSSVLGTASFIPTLFTEGTVLLLVILVLIRCCCCCCCEAEKPRKHKVGVDNLALEP